MLKLRDNFVSKSDFLKAEKKRFCYQFPKFSHIKIKINKALIKTQEFPPQKNLGLDAEGRKIKYQQKYNFIGQC